MNRRTATLYLPNAGTAAPALPRERATYIPVHGVLSNLTYACVGLTCLRYRPRPGVQEQKGSCRGPAGTVQEQGGGEAS